MIVIKLEMWPGGYEANKYELGRAYLWNDGKGTTARGNYDGAIMRKGDARPPHLAGAITRTGQVRGYPRLSYTVWELIRRFLNDALSIKKGDTPPLLEAAEIAQREGAS